MKISYPEISTDINILITDLLDNRLLWNGKKIKLESVIIRNSCALTSTNICHTHAYEHQCMCIHTVFPPKDGTMVLHHPLVLLPHPLILKCMLKNTVL